MKSNVVFSRASDDWATPSYIYERFMQLGFFDPCPLRAEIDGLAIWWGDCAFCNPPYSEVSKWVDKAIKECFFGCDVWLLVPARTDTRWFKKLYEFGCAFYFVFGRLSFNDKGSAPFPSVYVHLTGNSSNHCEFIDREVLPL